MTDLPDWTPTEVDLERPNAARMYDYYLGGGANFAVDREAAKQVFEHAPTIRAGAQLNRGFLRRAVEFCAAAGVRQFLDIGAGIPTVGNTHEIAQRIDPTSRVVYVDHEAVAVAHARHLLQGNENTAALQYDLRDVDQILADPTVRTLLDFGQPMAIMLISMLHFVPSDERLPAALRGLLDAVAPGSYLCISHGTYSVDPVELDKAVHVYRSSTTPVTMRTREEIRAMFDGTELVEPGVVFTPQWRPNSPEDVGEHPEQSLIYAGVGRKP